MSKKSKVVPAPTVRIRNNLRQMIPVNVRDKNGKTHGIEIPAYSDYTWPDVPDFGPDLMVKTRQKYLSIIR